MSSRSVTRGNQMSRRIHNGVALALVAAGGVAASAAALPTGFSDWSPATRVEAQPGTPDSFNGPALDGCPFISHDGRTLYMASNRPGGLGGLDIWVARRESPDDPWGAPENVGAPVNSAANDFCPTIDRNDHTLFFVSNRGGGCGGADIYVTRHRPDGWDAPHNVGCNVNSAADEASPSPLPEPGRGKVLYFSSVRPGGFAPDAAGATVGDSDLYVSRRHDGVYGTPELVPGVNTGFEDGQPNLRRDRREIFFFSNRPGTLGMADIYAATRASAFDTWSEPFNLGPNVNSADGAETRPSLSWDGTTLYFGSNRPGGDGSTDHYMTTRSRD
jgi:WD40-like Beta Propeller Repeat